MYIKGFRPVILFFVLLLTGITNPLIALADSVTVTPGISTLVLEPVDDANNRASLDGELAVSKWEHAFFRFDLNAISGDVPYAVFRVYHDGRYTPLDLYLGESDDNWSESTGTPAITHIFNDPTLQLDRVSVTGPGYVDFDIRDFIAAQIAGDRIATLELSSTTSKWSMVSSKEGVFPPQLLLDFNNPPIPSLGLITDPDSYNTIHVDAGYSTDTDGSIVSYEWDFGDGSISSGVQASYTYPVDGTYEVTLTVTDDQGASATESRTVSIRQPIDSYLIYPTADANNRVSLDGKLAVSRWEHAFLRFELGSIEPTMLSAVLRIYLKGNNLPLRLYAGAVGDDWSDAATTPKISMIQNRPDLQLAATDVTNEGYIELDLTDYIATQSFTDGIASIEIMSDSNTWSLIDSMEGPMPPELVITTGPNPDTGWALPALLDTNTAQPYTPKITADPFGNYMAVWFQNNRVWSKRYTPDNGWGVAEIISGFWLGDPDYNSELDISSDANGNLMAIWLDDFGIWYNRYQSGSGWKGAALAEEMADVYSMDFAMDNTGKTMLVLSSTRSIFAMQHDPDLGWGAITPLEDSEGGAGAPDVAVAGDGSAIAIWSQYDGNNYSIYTNQFLPGAGWGSAQLIDDSINSDSGEPGIVFTGAGNAIAVWKETGDEVNDYSSLEEKIISKRYSKSYGWESSVQLAKKRDNISPNWGDVKIAGDGAGNLVIAWLQYEGSSWNSYLSVNYTNQNGWSDQEYIGSNSDGGMGDLHMNQSGQAAITWVGVYGIVVNHFDINNGWSEQTRIDQSLDTSHGYTRSDITVAPSGEIMAIWGVNNYEIPDSSPSSIYASEFTRNQ